MKGVFLLAMGSIVGLAVGCGEQMRQAQETAKAISSVTQKAPKVETLQQQFERRQAERRARGDTTTLHYEKLLDYIPTSIATYQAVGDPDASTTSFGSFSISSAKRDYNSPSGSKLSIELIDYNANPASLALAGLGVYLNMSVDNDQERSQTFDPGLPISGAWESFRKKTHRAEVLYVLGGRFLLRVRATEQNNTDQVKFIAQQLNLRALASL